MTPTRRASPTVLITDLTIPCPHFVAVSYTHLDVYKRQGHRCVGRPRKRWLEDLWRRNRQHLAYDVMWRWWWCSFFRFTIFFGKLLVIRYLRICCVVFIECFSEVSEWRWTELSITTNYTNYARHWVVRVQVIVYRFSCFVCIVYDVWRLSIGQM